MRKNRLKIPSADLVLAPVMSGTVLIVDDDSYIREALTELLVDEGYRVLLARDGREALALLARDRPCLILLDIMMPVMDGVTFAHLLRRAADTELAHTPIVLLTAVSDANAIGEQIGAVDIIPKPIDLDRVAATVARHCRH